VISSVVTHSAACFDFRRPIAMLVKTSQTFPRSRVLDDYYHGLIAVEIRPNKRERNSTHVPPYRRTRGDLN